MKTLSELDPQVGDTVTYTAARETGTYTVLARTAEAWTFRSDDDPVDFSERADGLYGSQSRWSLKSKEQSVPTDCCQQPRYTLPQLNPKVGDVVLYWGLIYTGEYPVVGYKEGAWTLQEPDTDVFTVSPQYANQQRWTLKPQTKENKVTVADLNLSVGDRVQQGRWTGTVTDTNSQHVEVLWDWSTVRSRFTQEATPSLTLLPKPEPTLADLELQEGDCLWNPNSGGFSLVTDVGEDTVRLLNHYGNGSTLAQSTPTYGRKKVEVPK